MGRNLYLVLACCANLIVSNLAAVASERIPSGTWKGTYTCQQRLTGATLTFNPKEQPGDYARFDFYRVPSGPRVLSGSFLYKVRYNAERRELRLVSHRWLKRPATFGMIDVSGRFDTRLQRFSGRVHHGRCGEIRLTADVPVGSTSAAGSGATSASGISQSFGEPLPDKAIGLWPGEIGCPGTKTSAFDVRLEIDRTAQGPRVQLHWKIAGRPQTALYDYQYWNQSRRLELKGGKMTKGEGQPIKFAGNFWSQWDKFTGNASPGCYVSLAPPSPYKTTLEQSHEIYEIPARGRAPMVVDATGTLTRSQINDLNANLKTNGGYQLYVRIVDNLNGTGLRSRARKMLERMKKAGPPYENVIIISVSTSIAYAIVEWADVPQLPKHVTSHFVRSEFKPFSNKQPDLDAAIRRAVSYLNGQFAPVSTPSQLNDNLAGNWAGVAACRGKTQDVKLMVHESGPDTYSARLDAFRTFDFVIRKTAPRRYEAKSTSRTIREKIFLHAGSGTPPVLELDIRGGCHVAFFIRHEPIAGLGGLYSRQPEHREFCRKTVEPWQAEGRRVGERALRLKEDLYPHLQAFAHATAGIRAMFEDDIFRKYFGVKVDELTQTQFTKLIDQVRGCAMLRPTDSLYPIGDETIMFEEHSLRKAKADIDRSVFDGRGVRSVGFLRSLELNLRNSAPSIPLAELIGGLQSPDATADTIEQGLRKAAATLHRAPPTQSLEALASLSKRLDQHKMKRHRTQTAQRGTRNAALLKVSQVPFSRIPTRFHALLRSLANGDPVQLDDGTRLILGGIATELHAQCNLELSVAERAELLLFMKSTAERVVGGSNFGSLKFGEGWRDMANGQVIFDAGVAVGKAFNCAKPAVDGLIRLAMDAVQSNTRDADGGDPIFIRTCAQHLSDAQCRCLVKVGSSAIPNLHQQRYSRGLVHRIATGNLFAGMQLIAACQIARY
jgi:hypothetical protein